MQKPIVYLDFAATTPVDSRVMEAMNPYFTQQFGNPSSIHRYGQRAEFAVESARGTLSAILNCAPNEIIFTSGGSESDNLALRGAAYAARRERGANHILISPVEHHAIYHTAKQLTDHDGFELEYLPVDKYGMVQPETVSTRIRSETAIVSVIHANNEIGTINPIKEISIACKAMGIPFHTDAVQAGAHFKLDVKSLNIDMLSLGAHKFYGPKGVGLLYVRGKTPLIPILTGGSQEFGIRAGTHNVPYIVGLTEAFRLAQAEIYQRTAHIKPMRDQIINTVLDEIQGAQLTGHPAKRLPNHASFVFDGVDGNELLMILDAEGFACSSGSACRTGTPEPSETLLALNLPHEKALGSLRVTLGKETTSQEVDSFLSFLPKAISQARSIN